MRERSLYPKPFKAQVVQECLLPGATISIIVIHLDINANIISKWRKRSMIPTFNVSA
ncbi:transposase [Pseudomonas sp. R2-7-07]|uniref:transposase n=1 Tax=unclassified Pseudomonas TaxID=196821 RepID=UPI003556F803